MLTVIEWQKDRIRTKFNDAQIWIRTPTRLSKKCAIGAKNGCAEELIVWISPRQWNNVYLKKGVRCRRIGLLDARFNREANYPWESKSINNWRYAAAVEMKGLLLEQMREQTSRI